MSARTIMIRSLEDETENFDQVVDETTSSHNRIAQVTNAAFARLSAEDLDVNDGDSVETFVKLASLALKANGASETTAMRRMSAKLKMRESARQDGVSEAVTDVLLKMQDGKFIPTIEGKTLNDQAEQLSAQFTLDVASKLLSDIDETELRTNPDNLE